MTDSFGRLYPLVFLAAALALLLLERIPTLQRQRVDAGTRWTSNIGLWLIGNVVAAVILPAGIYAFAQQRPPGAIAWLGLPFAVQVLLTFVLLDAWKYLEHRVLHAVPPLWRAHLVHHSDVDVDVTTSERHHPFEAIIATATLAGITAAVGLPAVGLGLYLLTATVVALWSHANLRLPDRVDRMLRAIVVTPASHAVHHSSLRAQTDSNFGEVLTLWDRLFGTYVDPARATIRRFGLDCFDRRSDARLDRVLWQPFAFRRDAASQEPSVGVAAPASAARACAGPATWPPGTRDTLLAGAAGCALVVLAMWPTLVEMTTTWANRESYQYAWLVVPMVVYFLGWHDAAPLDPRPDWSGVAPVVVAALGFGAALLANIAVGRQLALVLALQGVAMSTLGWRSYRRHLPALALLFLMVPTGDLLQAPLRALTLASLQAVTTVLGLPHAVDGFALTVGTQRYIVVEDCAGLPYVTLGAFLGYCFGLLLYRSWRKIAGMALLGAGVGIASNVLRVNAIVLIDWLSGSQMDLSAHGAFQWIGLCVALGLLFAALARLDADAVDDLPTMRESDAVSPSRRFAPVAAGLAGLLIAGSAVGLHATDRTAAPGARDDAALPDAIADWRRAGPVPAWSIDAQAQTRWLRATYEHERDGRRIDVVVAETLSPGAKLPDSALLPGDRAAWRDKRADKTHACVEAACIALRHTTWERETTRDSRDAYSAYTLGSFVTDSRLALRALHGWHRLTRSPDAPRLIAVVAEGPPMGAGDIAAAFLAVNAALVATGAPR